MVDEILPRMESGEVDFFLQSLKSKRLYLEFGCGGSTVLAAKSDVSLIYSVDTSAEWIINVQQDKSVSKRIHQRQAFLYFIDVGKLKRWGKPATNEKRIIWPSYSAGIWLELPALPDVVLVDGRWRVACALQALWRCDNAARILVHDWDKREKYHQLLEFATIEDKAGSLARLAPKPARDRGLIAMRALEQMSDYS